MLDTLKLEFSWKFLLLAGTLFVSTKLKAIFVPANRWLPGLIDTYGGVQPDTDEVHIPVGKKSDIRANMMKNYKVGMLT